MKIDWKLLRKQKETLVVTINAMTSSDGDANVEHLDGIVNLLDALQDDAVESGKATEAEVFGEEENN